MSKGLVTAEIIEELKKIVGEKYVYTDKDKLDPYSHDEVTDPHYMKEAQVVVLPATTEEVSKVVMITTSSWFPVRPVPVLQPAP